MESDAGMSIKELRVDGGASADDLLMQFQADLLGVPLVRPVIRETTAQGAAYLAGLAVGYWAGPEEIQGLWQKEKEFHPARSARTDALKRDWKRAVERAKGWRKE